MKAEAAVLAEFLDKQNRERQDVEKKTFLAADEIIAKEFDPARDAAIVVSGPRLAPRRPRHCRLAHRSQISSAAIVIGIDESGMGKGSGRAALGSQSGESARSLCRTPGKFGGHEMAAGLTIREDKIDMFAQAFRAAARELLSDEDLEARLRLDHEVELAQLNVDLLRWHEMLQPFGNANPQPLFLARKVEPAAPPRILKDKHLVLRLRQGEARRAPCFSTER